MTPSSQIWGVVLTKSLFHQYLNASLCDAIQYYGLPE
jgi:hypothetical protein